MCFLIYSDGKQHRKALCFPMKMGAALQVYNLNKTTRVTQNSPRQLYSSKQWPWVNDCKNACCLFSVAFFARGVAGETCF